MLTPELKDNFLKNCAAQLHNVYGPTEAAIFATCGLCDEYANETSVSIGRAITPATIEILGPDLKPVANGEAGEVFIGGLGLARGYHNRPGLTAERFPPDPSGHKGERLYRTGDVARFAADGKIYYIGRVDQQVKIRGHRIELGPAPSLSLKPGARLVREWRGRTHTVTVTEDGFDYAGTSYPSLTKIAKKITGAHWSAPRFFGLLAAGAERPGHGGARWVNRTRRRDAPPKRHRRRKGWSRLSTRSIGK